ncbi:hypothetical protein [Micromonospora tulbaghiae]
MRAATVDCPLCGVTVLGQGDSVVEATSAAIDALETHINDHHQGDQ